MSDVNVEAGITVVVWKIEKETGKKVVEGDVLLILESMKMKIPLIAPLDGIIKEIKVEAKDAVEEGETMVILSV
ncbi:biotin/lipoyl-containing protein [Alteribacillus sp. YIM 98480]|uniref:biotin/lipoyl-containing protein n=1 Tax=Alteribacillus sp. YIM 98480 TaxID=2606599 RepID=UPI00131E355F|nr:biotin/lipoyl-containing protein [Alteribacillus sp. YIM 98480]